MFHVLPPRLFPRLFLPLAILVLAGTFFYGLAENERELTRLKSLEALNVGLGAGVLSHNLDAITRDLIFLASHSALRQAVETRAPQHLDHLAEDFANFSRSKGIYDQLRWIDETGMEMVRVDQVKGEATVIPAGQLQNKGKRYFFTDTFRLKPGEIFVSPLDLNVEHDKIEVPYKPMLRVAIPVTDSRGAKRGIVILNCYGRVMLDSFAETAAKIADHVMVVNGEGYWLKSPKTDDEWGFMFQRTDLSLAAQAPVAWANIRSTDSGQEVFADGLWTWESVYPLLVGQKSSSGAAGAFAPSRSEVERKQYVWKSVAHLSGDTLLAVRQAIWLKLAMVATVLLGLLGFGAWTLARIWAALASSEEVVRRLNAGLERQVDERTREWRDKVVELDAEIGEHKLAEVALRESEARYRLLTENIKDVVWILDTQTMYFRYVSPSVQRLRGYTAEEVLALPVTHALTTEAAAYLIALIRARTEEFVSGKEAPGRFYTDEVEQPCKHGANVWTEVVTSYYRNPDNGQVEARGVTRDITERRRADEVLREKEHRWKFAIEGTGAGILDWVIPSGEIQFSDRWLEMTGYAHDELAPRLESLMALVHPDDLPIATADVRAALEGRTSVHTVEHRLKHKQGHWIWVQSRSMISAWSERREPLRMIGTHLEITERKRGETLLRTRLRLAEMAQAGTLNELLQAALDGAEEVTDSQIGFFHFVDSDQENLTLQAWSTNTLARMCTAEGKGQHYAISQAGVWVDAFHQRAPVIHNDYASLAHRKGMPEGHAPVTRELVVPVIRAGKVTEIMGVGGKATDYLQQDVEAVEMIAAMVQDLVDRRRAEAALRESESRLSAVFQASPIGSSVSSMDGRILDVNDAALRLYGYARREVIGRSVAELGVYVNPAQRAELVQRLRERGSIDRFPIDFRKSSGEVGVMEVAARVIELQGEQCLVAMMLDVTERKRLEQVHLQAQKLEALGTLAGGIAHDFNNIVAAIMGNVELARQDVGSGHAALDSLEEIRKASVKAKDLVQQILAFGRRHLVERKVIALAPAVREAAALLRVTLPAGASLSVECAPDAPAVLADASQIGQVVLNLGNNAWQAIQDRAQAGMIEVRLQAHERVPGRAQDEGFVIAAGESGPGRYACLSVSDNGSGIDKETLARMFEPFFTTKPVGKGTGLGLSVVHGIAQEHGASIEVRSVPGAGSTFRIYFPAAQASEQIVQARTQGIAPAHGQGMHVLYVDDDESIVFLMTRLLQRQGYRVSGFTDAREALALARTNPAQFDLAVTDYNMPGMSGLEVARALKQIRAELPIALASGYITEELRQNAPAAGVSELIYKPNTVEDLCEAVARLAQTVRDKSKPS